MATRRHAIGLLVLVMAGTVIAAAQPECYVIDRRGKKHEGVELLVKSPQGDIELVVDKRIRLPFKADAYRFAFAPKPSQVAGLEKAFEQGEYDAVVNAADTAFEACKFLGWGDFVAYLKGMSLRQLGRPAEALEAFNRGRQYQGNYGGEILRGTVLALLDTKATDQAHSILTKMIASPRNEDAAFAFSTRARILEADGKSKEAVLEYLKVVLFFENSPAVQDIRDDARERAVAIMKTMNDGRWQRVEDIE